MYDQNPFLLIADFQAGKQDAFRYIFDQLNDRLMGFCFKSLHHTYDEAEDFVADCWTKIYIHRTRFETLEHIKRFAHVVIRNAHIDKGRKEVKEGKSIREYNYLNEDVETDEAKDKETQVALLRKMIEGLSPRRKKIVELRFFKKMDTSKIAELLNIAPQTCLNHIATAVIELRKMMANPSHYLNEIPVEKLIIESINVIQEEPIVVISPPIPTTETSKILPLPTHRQQSLYDSDKVLLFTDFKAGDRKAYQYLFDYLNPRLLWFARSISKGKRDIDDIVAECWYTLFVKRESFTSIDHIRRFCYQCVRWYHIHVIKEHIRQNKIIDGMLTIIEKEDDPISRLSSERHNEKVTGYIWDYIQVMGGKQSEVMNLNFFGRLTVEEVADKMGITLKACYKNRADGIRRVKNHIESIQHLLSA